MTSDGLSFRIRFTESMCQQSPNFGNPPTGATSAHHFVTPTRCFFAPSAHRMEVALGAKETILNAGPVGMRIARVYLRPQMWSSGLSDQTKRLAYSVS